MKPYPGFKEFSDFVAEEARVACNPVSSLFALKQADVKTGKEHKRLKASTLATSAKMSQKPKDSSASESSIANSPATQTKRQIDCVCCQQNQFIYKCERFAAMPLEENKKFVISNYMCFGCLRAAGGVIHPHSMKTAL